MTRLVRAVGFGLMALGAVLFVVWAVEPFRAIWPWLRSLPLPLRIGVIASMVGLAVLFGSLIAERLRDRDADRHLLDEP